jgi:hypothetical protein
MIEHDNEDTQRRIPPKREQALPRTTQMRQQPEPMQMHLTYTQHIYERYCVDIHIERKHLSRTCKSAQRNKQMLFKNKPDSQWRYHQSPKHKQSCREHADITFRKHALQARRAAI